MHELNVHLLFIARHKADSQPERLHVRCIDIILVYCLLSQVSIAKTLVQRHHVPNREIAVLTPYSAQKEEIKKRMNAQHLGDILVKTITESQGMDCM